MRSMFLGRERVREGEKLVNRKEKTSLRTVGLKRGLCVRGGDDQRRGWGIIWKESRTRLLTGKWEIVFHES